jgi:uncharacterized protein (TIGR02466 family)
MTPEIIESENHTEQKLSVGTYFPTNVYSIKKIEFLDSVKKSAYNAVSEQSKNYDDIYPVVMSGNIFEDETIKDFTDYIGNTAWNILNDQGYAMENYELYFTEMWMQEHHKHSLMEQHSHAGGIQMVGFYFLETPENCSKLLMHDPRPAKVQINLQQKNDNIATYGSDIINFVPEPGLLIFTNAWLPHSFGRHASDDPIRFIHFNLNVKYNSKECQFNQAEII